MPNLSTLAPLTTAATALSNLILVSPQKVVGYQPQNSDGSLNQQAPTLVFNYEGEQAVALESDITDHYVENNSAIQDQWTLRPETVTTHGFIGELTDIAPNAAFQAAKVLADKLVSIGAYTPELSASALLAYNEAVFLYSTAQNALANVNATVSAWSSINAQDGENVIGGAGLGSAFNDFTGAISGNQTKQQIAFQQFYGFWRARTLFTVQTPWAIFQNMAIKSLRAVQDADTRMITDFEVTFKMMRFASINVGFGTLSRILSNRLALQSSPPLNQGTQTGSGSYDYSKFLSGFHN